MSNETPPCSEKLPYFEHYSRPDLQAISTIHELPYDHSILLENFMDPAHVPISHDRSDFYSKREDAQPLVFETIERSSRGFAGKWSKSRNPTFINFLRFEAPCALQNNHEYIDKTGRKQYVSSLFLCRPIGQGKSMVITRFGTTLKSPVMKFLPKWFFHQNICKVLEQDMGFLSSQNEILMKEMTPVGKMYINLGSCDTWVLEYRKWKDRVGHGMPYYFGHSSISLPNEPALVEQYRAGLDAGISASMPAKGGIADIYASNPINRYSRHVVHCKKCRDSVKGFGFWRNTLVGLAVLAVALAVLASRTQWKVLFLVSAALFLGGQYVCYSALNLVTTNFIRSHRRL
ncbi:protein TIC 55, chloroplastic-like isoform X2 [Asparagus officinalis]|nr:protein TIC 55, chloroplastic-like isoform X2 [Asparagus officinalis]